MVKKSCYWWVDPLLSEDKKKFVAICEECYKNVKEENPSIKNSWYWDGTKLGYGNYDLSCHFCNTSIHKAEQND